ncbi:MAG: glycosyltransferase family 4 protein, partial [Burkholderiales bacterium]
VHLVCKGKEGLPAFEDKGGLKIHRIRMTPIPSFGAVSRLLSAPLPVNPYWYVKTLGAFREARVECLIVRDLPLALLAGILGKRLKIPVFFDMAENYPAALVAYDRSIYKPFLFGNGWLPKQYEKLSLRYMEHVFVVAEEQIARLANAGLDRNRISVVMNTPDVEYYQDCVRQQRTTPSESGRQNLLYIGKVDAHRGVDLLVRAMPGIGKRYPAATLHIVGDGTEKNALEKLATVLGVADRVAFHGWVNFEKVPGFISGSTVCFIPHLRSEHTETTVPNKIFDYMAFAKPVVVSDCAPLARIVNETQCGRVFRSGDADDLAKEVLALLADPNRETIGANGSRAVVERFHWRRDAAVFLARLKRGRQGTARSV